MNYKQAEAFVTEILYAFNAKEKDIRMMIWDEYDRLLSMTEATRTEGTQENFFAKAVENCRAWAAAPRKQITAEDIAWYCPARNYFNAIKRKVSSQ